MREVRFSCQNITPDETVVLITVVVSPGGCYIIGMVDGPSLKGRSPKDTPLILGQNYLVANRMPLILPLTNGHLSNEDRIIWLKRCPYSRETTVLVQVWKCM